MHLFGNAILLECFLSKVTGSLRVKHFKKAYLSKPYNGIQITFDSFLLGGSAASFPFSEIYVWWSLPSLRDPGNIRTSWYSGLHCSRRNNCFLQMLRIFVSQMKVLLECLFPRKYFNCFHPKLEQINISKW